MPSLANCRTFIICRTFFVGFLVLVTFPRATTAQWYTQYRNLNSINARLSQFEADYPDLVESFVIGQSFEGRDIRGIRIRGTGGDREHRPATLLNGTQHAREWISPMTNMYAAEEILSRYATDANIRELVDDVDVYVIPVSNPDGYQYSWTTDRLWRKNRRPVGLGIFGVDLNRNWDYGWGMNSGSSPSPSSTTYRGPAPFSEPETQALRDFYHEHQNLVSNIDFHSYSQLILYPYGFSALEEPADGELMRQLAIQMSGSMEDVHGVYYDPISASDLYLASGVSIDWTYGDQNVYSYTIELRPGSFFPGFELPPEEIIPTSEEAFAGVLDLLDFTRQLSLGDANYDGVFDCSDLDALYAAVLEGTSKAEFDIDGDGAFTAGDVDAWLVNAGATMLSSGSRFLPGDANLDGTVDTSDFNLWNNAKFTAGGGWCAGDFNADGSVDTSDFNIWNTHKFQSSETVPEPRGLLLLGISMTLVGRRVSKHGDV